MSNNDNKIATDRDGTVTAQIMDDRLDKMGKRSVTRCGDAEIRYGSGHTPRPFTNFPPGRVRIRQRVNSFVTAFIKSPHGIRQFVIAERDGLWYCDPKYEMGSNLRDDGKEPRPECDDGCLTGSFNAVDCSNTSFNFCPDCGKDLRDE